MKQLFFIIILLTELNFLISAQNCTTRDLATDFDVKKFVNGVPFYLYQSSNEEEDFNCIRITFSWNKKTRKRLAEIKYFWKNATFTKDLSEITVNGGVVTLTEAYLIPKLYINVVEPEDFMILQYCDENNSHTWLTTRKFQLSQPVLINIHNAFETNGIKNMVFENKCNMVRQFNGKIPEPLRYKNGFSDLFQSSL